MRRSVLATAALFLLVTGIRQAMAAEEWTRFRGPNGTGLSESPFNAPLGERNVAWKITLPGIGHSSPVIWKDRVYLTTGDPETARRILMCIGAKDGNTIWAREFGSTPFRQHTDNSYASATPAVDELGVYVSWSVPASLQLLAVSHEGKELWKQDLGPFISQHGSGTSPVVVDDLVILPNDQEGPKSSAAAFDKKTGQLRWKIDRKAGDKTATSTPCLYQPKDGPAQLILTSKATGITSHDPKTGKLLWEAPAACPARPVGSPVIAGDLVITGSGDGAGDAVRHLVAVHAPATGTKAPVAYKLTKITPYVPTPVVTGDWMFMWADSGIVTCVKAATGETVWSERASGQFYGSPVCAGDTLWAMNRRGKLVGIAAADQYRLVGEYDLGEPTQATPAIANGRMYLRTQSHLTCMVADTGKVN